MRRDAWGFSLLELLVALALVAIGSGTLLWTASAWMPDFHLESATRQVVVELRTLRARTMAERTAHRLVFSVATDRYRPQRRVDGTYENTGPETPLPRGIDLADCTALGDAIGFAPRGTAATFGTVTLENREGRRRHVIVDIVGRVRVE